MSEVAGESGDAKCLASLIARSNGEVLRPERDADLIAGLEAATAVESNLITQVYECQVPGCEGRGVANYHGEELLFETGPSARECVRKFGSSMLLNASK